MDGRSHGFWFLGVDRALVFPMCRFELRISIFVIQVASAPLASPKSDYRPAFHDVVHLVALEFLALHEGLPPTAAIHSSSYSFDVDDVAFSTTK